MRKTKSCGVNNFCTRGYSISFTTQVRRYSSYNGRSFLCERQNVTDFQRRGGEREGGFNAQHASYVIGYVLVSDILIHIAKYARMRSFLKKGLQRDTKSTENIMMMDKYISGMRSILYHGSLPLHTIKNGVILMLFCCNTTIIWHIKQ